MLAPFDVLDSFTPLSLFYVSTATVLLLTAEQ